MNYLFHREFSLHLQNVMVFAGTGGLSLANNKYETFYLPLRATWTVYTGSADNNWGGDKAK